MGIAFEICRLLPRTSSMLCGERPYQARMMLKPQVRLDRVARREQDAPLHHLRHLRIVSLHSRTNLSRTHWRRAPETGSLAPQITTVAMCTHASYGTDSWMDCLC